MGSAKVIITEIAPSSVDVVATFAVWHQQQFYRSRQFINVRSNTTSRGGEAFKKNRTKNENQSIY